MTDIPRIAVIGAGLAGLSCASLLQEMGCSVTVFEKSRGPGGRMSTRSAEDWQCDHGAQYFTARHPDFQAEVRRWQHHSVAALWTPRMAVLGDAGGHRLDPALERYVGVPGMTAPARWLARGLDVHLSTHIQRIEAADPGWRLVSLEHGRLDQSFDIALLALPAPQAVPLLQPHASGLAAVAAGARMRGCWALMTRYPSALGLGYDAAFVNDEPLRWVARNSAKPARTGPETWLLHASAAWSEAHLEQDAEDVAAALLAAFAKTGARAPSAWTAHRWRYADMDVPLALGCAWDARLRIGMCGDWLHGGKVEGAWLSGRKLAKTLLQSLVAH